MRTKTSILSGDSYEKLYMYTTVSSGCDISTLGRNWAIHADTTHIIFHGILTQVKGTTAGDT